MTKEEREKREDALQQAWRQLKLAPDSLDADVMLARVQIARTWIMLASEYDEHLR